MKYHFSISPCMCLFPLLSCPARAAEALTPVKSADFNFKGIYGIQISPGCRLAAWASKSSKDAAYITPWPPVDPRTSAGIIKLFRQAFQSHSADERRPGSSSDTYESPVQTAQENRAMYSSPIKTGCLYRRDRWSRRKIGRAAAPGSFRQKLKNSAVDLLSFYFHDCAIRGHMRRNYWRSKSPFSIPVYDRCRRLTEVRFHLHACQQKSHAAL